MAQNFDLEEQEQLDQLKHFWDRYGAIISGVLLAILLALAAWNGYNWWRNNKAAQATGVFDALLVGAENDDAARVQQALDDLHKSWPDTLQALQGGLLAGRFLHDKEQVDDAAGALRQVAANKSDAAYAALASLRLSGILIEQGKYDEALAVLGGDFPGQFAALAADRRGDILFLQGKKTEAIAAWQQALNMFDIQTNYRRMVMVKLNAQGVPTPDGAAS